MLGTRDTSGELFDPTGTGTPKDDIGEFAWLEIIDNIEACPRNFTTASTCGAWWNGLYHQDAIWWDPVNHSKQTDKVEIKDGAIVKIRTDSNNDGVINQADDAAKKVLGNAGRLFMVNDDDDNKNGIADNQERPSDFNTPKNRSGNGGSVNVANENDLAQTELYVWIDSLTPQAGKPAQEVDVYLYGPQEFVIWTQPTKGQRLHYGKDANNDLRMDYETTLTTLTASNLTYTRTVYIEANTMRPAGGTQFGDILLKTDVINSTLDGFDDVRFTPVKVECTDMAFNHEPGTNSDGAMNLRQDGSADTEIIAPEWSPVNMPATSGNDGHKNQKAVLYLRNEAVEVYVRLKTTNIPAGTKVSVKANGKAIDVSGNEVALSIGDLQVQTFIVQSDGTLRPDIPNPSSVMKTINGIAGFIKFTASGSTSNGINYENAKFDWEVTKIGGNTTGSNKATVADGIKLFTVLADPSGATTTNSPWNVADYPTVDDKEQPWVSVLELACLWAKDKSSPSNAIKEITKKAYSEFGKTKTYAGEYQWYTKDSTFNLTGFMAGEYGKDVDCQDMSAVVQLFSQVVGVSNVQVQNIDGPFWYKPIKPIGERFWDDFGRWDFHQVVLYEENVYSACELLNEPNPTQAVAMSMAEYKTLLFDERVSETWNPLEPFHYTTFY